MSDDKTLIQLERLGKLYTGVVADALDEMGIMTHSTSEIRPLTNDTFVVGVAFPILATEVFRFREEAFMRELEALDNLQPTHVVVAQTTGITNSSLWGELMTTAAMARGGRGAVVDGLCRDSNRIREYGFPLFVRGFTPYSSKARCEIVDINCPIRCGGVPVSPGDLVIGDADGVVVVPRAAVEEAIARAERRKEVEDIVRAELQQGKPLVQVYYRYRVI